MYPAKTALSSVPVCHVWWECVYKVKITCLPDLHEAAEREPRHENLRGTMSTRDTDLRQKCWYVRYNNPVDHKNTHFLRQLIVQKGCCHPNNRKLWWINQFLQILEQCRLSSTPSGHAYRDPQNDRLNSSSASEGEVGAGRWLRPSGI